jgi:hypothetical protein
MKMFNFDTLKSQIWQKIIHLEELTLGNDVVYSLN